MAKKTKKHKKINGVEVLPKESEVEILESEPISEPPFEELEILTDLSLPGENDGSDDDQKSSSKALTVFDPLRSYLREIARYSRISAEEEKILALRYVEKKDLKAAKKLVLSNLWLVVKIARDYEAAARNLLDLVQEGNMGLMEAVKNFDPHKEVRFPSYASWWIKAYIIRYVIANWRLVKIGTTQAQRKLFFNLKREKERLEREGILPEPKLLAERLQVRERDVVEMEQRMSHPDASFDAPAHQDSENSLFSIIPSGEMTAEELVGERQIRGQLTDALGAFSSSLSERDRVIFEERMLGEEKATLQEISDRFNLSKERVRQLENRIRERLKAFLKDRLGETLQELDIGE